MPLGCCAFPTWPGEQEAAAAIAGRSGADVVEVEGVVIDQLDAEIALLFDCRHGEHERFGTQVRADEGVKRVRVGRLDRLVRGREDVVWLFQIWFKGPLYSGFALSIAIGVLDAIIVHDREAVDIDVLGEGAGFRRTEAGLGAGCCEMECREQGDPADKASSCKCFRDPSLFLSLYRTCRHQ